MIEYPSTRACADCGVANPVVLEFHHVRGKKEKRREVSTLMCFGYPWTEIEQEIAKCIVLCANCPRTRTAAERGRYRARVRGDPRDSAGPV
jgi:hypothetical protein